MKNFLLSLFQEEENYYVKNNEVPFSGYDLLRAGYYDNSKKIEDNIENKTINNEKSEKLDEIKDNEKFEKLDKIIESKVSEKINEIIEKRINEKSDKAIDDEIDKIIESKISEKINEIIEKRINEIIYK